PRLVRLGAIGLAGQLAALSVFTWHLQQANGAQLRAAGQSQMSRCVPVPAPRGIITDRHGVPVATDAALDQVLVAPALVRGRPQTSRQLAALTGITSTTLQRLLDQPADDAMVKLGVVPAAVGARLQFSQLPGVLVYQTPRRVYPYGPLLGPLLGF